MTNQVLREDPWDYLHPYAAKLFGPDIQDREKRAAWCRALFCGGNSLRLWNSAPELKIALLSACALREGQKVLLISKYGAESGFVGAIRSLLGRDRSSDRRGDRSPGPCILLPNPFDDRQKTAVGFQVF